MARDKLEVAVSNETTVEREIVRALPVSAPSLSMRTWALSVAVQALLFVGLCAGVIFLRIQVNALKEATAAQRDATAGWTTQAAALTNQTEALKNETLDLRQYLSSSAAEDLLFLKIMVLKPSIDQEMARTIARHVHHYAELHSRDPNLVLAIISVESDFNPKAMSPVGATGLMQVMPQWRKVLGITGDLQDPETSIRYGLQVLGFYIEMYKDLEVALTAYNRGPGPVDMALMRGKSPKNDYPGRVLATYEKLKRLSVSTGRR